MNMQLPPRVQEQLQAAEVLEAQEQAARQAVPPALSVADVSLQSLTAPTSAPPQTAAAPVQAPAPDGFEQKYKTLQGMYNADVNVLRNQLKDVVSQIDHLKAKAATAPEPKQSSVDPKDIENFGEQMMEMVQRYVTGVAQTLDARITYLEAQLTGAAERSAVTAEQQFYVLLTKLIPDWRAINADDKWLVWLGVRDEVYGIPRQSALDNAFKNGDAQQVANVFNAFKNAQPVPIAPPSLENQITPEGAGNPAPQLAPAKPILSEKAITAFYNDMGRGRYVGREAEATALEDIINQAVAEGRVR